MDQDIHLIDYISEADKNLIDTYSYENVKQSFEKNNFYIKPYFYHIMDDGELTYYNKTDAKLVYGDVFYYTYDYVNKVIIKNLFYKEWVNDKDSHPYEFITFHPSFSSNLPNVYNLYKGLNAEKYFKGFELSEEEFLIKINPILNYFDVITNNQKRVLLKWLANMIQHPEIKNEKAIFFGSSKTKNNFFDLEYEFQYYGIFKFFEWFGNNIIGSNYFIKRKCYKNSPIKTMNVKHKQKLFILVDITSMENTTVSAVINNRSKPFQIYKTNDYSNFIFINYCKQPNLFPNKKEHIVFNLPKIEDNHFFDELKMILKDESMIWNFYYYLKIYNIHDY